VKHVNKKTSKTLSIRNWKSCNQSVKSVWLVGHAQSTV